MEFVVRYWSSCLPKEFCKAGGSSHLIDYSVHPPTRLGLHNALLSRHDRLEILEAQGGEFECEVFVVKDMESYVLTEEIAIRLFNTLPHGEVKWTAIHKFVLPQNGQEATDPHAMEELAHERQLHIFEYTHQPDADISSHHFDMDA